MAFDRRFLLLSAGEVLVVAVGDILVALVLQVIIIALFLKERRGYPVFVVGVALFAMLLTASSTIHLPLLALAAALGVSYVALILKDYRIVLRAGDTA